MSDGLEFLENEALYEAVREKLRDGKDEKQACAEALTDAKVHVRALTDTVSSCTHACARALHKMEEEIRGFLRRITPRGVGFGNRDDVFGHVCVFLICMEEHGNALEAALYPCYFAKERINECRAALLEANMLIHTVRAGAELPARWDVYLTELTATEASLSTAQDTFLIFQGQVLSFFSEQLPSFAKQVRKCADFAHRGEGCDTQMLLRLCDALLYAIRQVNCGRQKSN